MINIRHFNSPIKFGHICYPNSFQTPAHVLRFNELAVQLLYSSLLNKLIVSVPIRHGKSYFFSTLLPAWNLIVNPYSKILLVSNTLDRAVEFASDVRKLVTEFGHINNVELDHKWRSREKFKTAQGGGLQAFGTGASIAGLGYNLGICDDLYKNQEEANSATQRQKLALWMNAEFLTRQLPGAKTIVVGSRRHPSDITATLLKLNDEIPSAPQKWKEVLFKAIDDSGSALWPERYSLEYLQAERSKLEAQGAGHVFESLWQNNPIHNGVGEWSSTIVGDFLLTKDLPQSFTHYIIAADPATHKTDKGDNSVALVIGFTSDGMSYIVDGVCGRMDVEQLEFSILKFNSVYSPKGIILEVNGFQSLIATSLLRKCPDLPLIGYNAVSNKEERIKTLLTGRLHKSAIKIKDCPMGRTILNEMVQFPTAEHDDCIDALAYGIGLNNYLSGLTESIYEPIRYN